MRSGISWPKSGSRRLDVGMAEESPRSTSTRVFRRDAWSRERIAESLVRERDVLVERLPRELAAARGMSRDQCEWVIDEAIDFMVTEYARPIVDQHGLDRAFWASAAYRVKRVHEGRSATIRAGWKRVDVDSAHLASERPGSSHSGDSQGRGRRSARVRCWAYGGPASGARLQVRRRAGDRPTHDLARARHPCDRRADRRAGDREEAQELRRHPRGRNAVRAPEQGDQRARSRQCRRDAGGRCPHPSPPLRQLPCDLRRAAP